MANHFFYLPIQEILAGSLSVMEFLVLKTPPQYLIGVHRDRGRTSIRVTQKYVAAVLATHLKSRGFQEANHPAAGDGREAAHISTSTCCTP